MKIINIFACFLLIQFVIIGCKNNNDYKTEKFHKHREKIINIKEQITDIKTKVLLGYSSLYIIDSFLIIADYKAANRGIHLFNKNTFKYITSTGILGRGPGEIGRYGLITTRNNNRVFWMSDFGKQIMWKFSLDSVLNDEQYKPTKELFFGNKVFLIRYDFLNDSIVLGKALDAIDHNSYVERMAKLNINSNKMKKYGYVHPKAKGRKSRSHFKLSVENNFYVNSYIYSDLLTICDLDGNLKYNIYGPEWLSNKNSKTEYFGRVDLINNNIIAAYNGEAGFFINEFKRPESNNPNKFLIFDMAGNYIETIETGYHFTRFCVDEENKRVIVYFEDRENPLGYFSLNVDKQ